MIQCKECLASLGFSNFDIEQLSFLLEARCTYCGEVLLSRHISELIGEAEMQLMMSRLVMEKYS